MENKMATFVLIMPDGREYISEIPLVKSTVILRAATILGMGFESNMDSNELDEDVDGEEHLYCVKIEETFVHTVYIHATNERHAEYRSIDIINDDLGVYDSDPIGDFRIAEIKKLEVDESIIQ